MGKGETRKYQHQQPPSQHYNSTVSNSSALGSSSGRKRLTYAPRRPMPLPAAHTHAAMPSLSPSLPSRMNPPACPSFRKDRRLDPRGWSRSTRGARLPCRDESRGRADGQSGGRRRQRMSERASERASPQHFRPGDKYPLTGEVVSQHRQGYSITS